MNYKEVRELSEWLDKSSFTSYTLSIDGVQLSVNKQQTVCQHQSEHTLTAVAGQASLTTQVPCENVHIIFSPIVGIYYESSSPGKPSFVQVGQHVKKGDVLCVLEAMKIMNEIIAEVDGIVTEIFVSNGSMVEACMPLLKIET